MQIRMHRGLAILAKDSTLFALKQIRLACFR
jgi:hypothetical protein